MAKPMKLEAVDTVLSAKPAEPNLSAFRALPSGHLLVKPPEAMTVTINGATTFLSPLKATPLERQAVIDLLKQGVTLA